MSRIYTRGGDRGETGLFHGERVPKNAPRVHACGSVDELNATLGLALAQLGPGEIAERLAELQPDLFAIGSHLAAPGPESGQAEPALPPLPETRIAEMEQWIDAWQAEIPPLRRFIMPGGSLSGATLHVARAICRRAEREVVGLDEQEPVGPAVLRYLNRLSDLLFVAAGLANFRLATVEHPWLPRLENAGL